MRNRKEDEGRPEDDMFWKERDEREFQKMVEELYGADPPKESPEYWSDSEED